MNNGKHTHPGHVHPGHINYGRGAEALDRAEQASGYRPVGHEAFLRHLEGSGVPIVVKLLNGTEVTGPIKASDRQTISIREDLDKATGAYITRVLFKHAIAEFQPMISLAAKSKEVH